MQAIDGPTRQSKDSSRAFRWALAGALALHALFLFSPWFNMDRGLESARESIHVQLLTPPLIVDAEEPESLAASVPEVAPAKPPEMPPEEPPEKPAPAVAAEPPVTDLVPPSGPISQTENVNHTASLQARVLASPYLEEESPAADLFSMRIESNEAESAFHFRDRVSLDSALNPVPAQLPFANGPRFEVASYTPGAIGDVQRFFDAVTLKKEWVTKNGTRVACVWVLILAGCGWD
jgi:hypothetical protein